MSSPTIADLTAKLVELERHPGLEHLRRYAPSGVTAQRWSAAERLLRRLWIELDALSDSGEIERFEAACAEVNGVLDAVDEVNSTVAALIAPLLTQIDAIGVAVPAVVTDLLAVSASDPLSLTTDEIERRISEITEVVALHTSWPDAVADTSRRIDALGQAIRRASRTRERATRQVLSGPLPVCTDPVPSLWAELQSITAKDVAALTKLRAAIASALHRVRRDEALAQGLLDRRAELKGRLRVYAAKTARLGIAGDPDLVSSRRVASELLSRRPCDLRAATQAVVDYQQRVSDKRRHAP